MTAELPDWVDSLAGFDRTRWYLPIVCTDRGKHGLTFLAIVFDSANGNGLHEAGPEHMHRERIEAWGKFPEPPPSDRPSLHPRLTARRGSFNFTCPNCRQTPRISRAEFGKAADDARRVGLSWLDVSLVV
jgi:hypothetical protein